MKNKILKLNRNSTKKINENLIKKVSPKYFMPYAGFFDEASERDIFIKENNQKNKIKDYEYLEDKYNLNLLNVEKLQFYKFIGDKLTESKGGLLPENQSLNQTEKTELFKNTYNTIENEFIVDYFVSSNFKKDFNLLIDLTDDNFNSLEQIKINFYHDSKPKVSFVENNKISEFSNNFNTLHLKIRKDVFVYTLKNLMPWEDILIGFQVRINRSPNVYIIPIFGFTFQIFIQNTMLQESQMNATDAIC